MILPNLPDGRNRHRLAFREGHTKCVKASPTEPSLNLQGGKLTYHLPVGSAGRRGGGIRGKVTECSDASRRRLARKFAALDWAQLALALTPIWFVTLTTSEEIWNDHRRAYMGLRRVRDWITSRPGFVGAFCRKELGGKNGMLHYHLVVVGIPGFARLLPELRRCWQRGIGCEKTWRVEIDEVNTAERASKYLSKYCAKAANWGRGEGADLSKAHNVDSSGQGYTGNRWWYVWGEDSLPWAEPLDVFLGEGGAVAKRIRRVFRKWLKVKIREALFREFPKASGELKACIERCAKRQEREGFAEWLRSNRAGFTILASPTLISQIVQYAVQASLEQSAELHYEGFDV